MANYTYTVSYQSDGKGGGSVIIVKSGTFTPDGLSSGSPLVLAANDTITLNIGDSNSYFPIQVDGVNGVVFTLTSGTLSAGLMTSAGDPYVFTHANIATNNVVSSFKVSAGVGSAYLYWKQSGDSIPATPNINTTNKVPGNLIQKTFTVSGLATNYYAAFALYGGDLKVNTAAWVNSNGVYNPAIVKAKNGDTIALRGYAPPFYDGSKSYKFRGYDGALNGFEIDWEVKTLTNPSAAYGFASYNSSGVELLSVTSRSARWVQSGTVTFTNIAAQGSQTKTVTVTGMSNTDDWTILLSAPSNISTQVTSLTKNTGSFSVVMENYGSTTVTITLGYTVFLTG